MIVLLVTHEEAELLVRGQPSVALKQYLASELRHERMLPDDNLPAQVLLEQLTCGDRGYEVIVRTYADTAGADRAWGTS